MIIRKKYSYSGLNREGEDGTFLCIPGVLNKRMFLNKQVVQIYNECNGHTISSLLELQKARYKEEDEEKLKKDLENILWFFNNIGMLELRGDDLMVIQETKQVFQMISEKDFNEVVNYIISSYANKNQNSIFYTQPQYNINSYQDLISIYNLPNVRLSRVSGGNIYYKFSREGSKKVDGVISFHFIESNTTLYLNLIVCWKDEFSKVLKLLYNEINQNGYKKLKIKVLHDENLESLLLENGFIKEAVLKGETFNDEEMIIYSLEK
ncbi:hypothetical protein B9N56_06750 [Finegoldia magna]|uniref:Uncharacterized protein n=1 Tax=Finegoldia magna TaxID=1260 RepID=A0A233VY99_FINMA|nr:hypothetical protein [Finegoldia magna]OXZ37385.1 hypothetical protein B9N56_06750 [Finegoldia magna]